MDKIDLFTLDLTDFSSDVVDIELLKSIIAGPLTDYSDADVAAALVDLVHDQLRRFGTDKSHNLSVEKHFRLLVRACTTATNRLGVTMPTLPFRDFQSFQDFFKG